MRGVLKSTLILLGSLSTAVALSVAVPDWVHENQPVKQILPPRGWVIQGRPDPSQVIRLRIGLRQSRALELEQTLLEISDPYAYKYGQHLTKEEAEAFVEPHKETIDLVDEWLEYFGVSNELVTRSPAKDWVMVNVSIAVAEEMLKTTYNIWKHVASGDTLIRTTFYVLPARLQDHIDTIQPTTMFSRFRGQKSGVMINNPPPRPTLNGAGSGHIPSCATNITINCLQQLYNTIGYTPTNKSNSIGITGFLEQYASISDLQAFYSQQRPDALNSSFNFVSVQGGLNNQSLPGVEANLDVQFAFGLSYPINATFYSTAGRPDFIPDLNTQSHMNENTNEPFMDWVDYVSGSPNPPLTISMSYGDDEQTVPPDYAQRVCHGFAQLGARGVSIVFASGDLGVGDGSTDPTNTTCQTNDGLNKTRFIPNFPASCPYVTAVGSTTGISPETATTMFFSGSGFSNYFSRPDYQNETVNTYLSSFPSKYSELFNSSGRAYPDVAAQGENYEIVYQGKRASVSGTSASAPAFAAVVALLNDVRLNNNQPPLGFLNPFIYSIGNQGFNDITTGYSGGCGTSGFNTSQGWDPVTGFGSPDFAKLKELVVKPSG